MRYFPTVLRRICCTKRKLFFRFDRPADDETLASTNLLCDHRMNNHLLAYIFGVQDGERLSCSDYINSDVRNGFCDEDTTSDEV